jgi:hypothetical protein
LSLRELPSRRLTVRDLIPTEQVNSDVISYVHQKTFTNQVQWEPIRRSQ